MKRKVKVAVLMGGRSPEYEISLISGREVVRNLPKKFLPMPIVISRDGRRWLKVLPKKLLSLPNPLTYLGTNKEIIKVGSQNKRITKDEISGSVDVVFIAMHGPFGEDGKVQGMLDLAGISYTGSGLLASALGMDKLAFRKIMENAKIPIPKYVAVFHGESLTKVYKVLPKPPYFVKPSSQGSSVGASIVKTKKLLKNALKKAFKYGSVSLVDEYIKGKELTCALLGNENPIALPVIEIVPLKGEFFDYQSKYSESGAEEIVPAKIPKALTKKIQQLSIKVYEAIGCRGFARVDFLVKNGKNPVVLEINTIPGLTPMSLLPKAAKAAGYSYPKLLGNIIKYALES